MLIMHNSKQTSRSAMMKVIVAIGNVGNGRVQLSFVKDDTSAFNTCLRKTFGQSSSRRTAH